MGERRGGCGGIDGGAVGWTRPLALDCASSARGGLSVLAEAMDGATAVGKREDEDREGRVMMREMKKALVVAMAAIL